MLVCVSFFILHTGPRVQRASGIPRALCFQGAKRLGKPRADRAARTRNCVALRKGSIPRPSCPGLTRASTSLAQRRPKTWMAGSSPAMTKFNDREDPNCPSHGLDRLQSKLRLDRIAHHELLDLSGYRHRKLVDELD